MILESLSKESYLSITLYEFLFQKRNSLDSLSIYFRERFFFVVFVFPLHYQKGFPQTQSLPENSKEDLTMVSRFVEESKDLLWEGIEEVVFEGSKSHLSMMYFKVILFPLFF